MSSTGVIRRRVPWAALLALAFVGASAYFIDTAEVLARTYQGISEDDVRQLSATLWLPVSYFFSWVSWFGAAFALISLVNVLAELVMTRGVHDHVVGFLGGLLFWFGVDTVNIVIIPLAIEQVYLEQIGIEVLAVGAILTVVGITLMVKG
jgi:hypothetical protein